MIDWLIDWLIIDWLIDENIINRWSLAYLTYYQITRYCTNEVWWEKKKPGYEQSKPSTVHGQYVTVSTYSAILDWLIEFNCIDGTKATEA